MRKYTREELAEMDTKADKVLRVMTGAGAAMGFLPIGVNTAVWMATMGGHVVAIGACYGYTLSNGKAGELIKEFLKAAGMSVGLTTTAVSMGTGLLKLIALPAYVPLSILDAVAYGASAYAVGITGKNYFMRAQGEEPSEEDIKRWMEDGREEGKTKAREEAERLAAEKKNKK